MEHGSLTKAPNKAIKHAMNINERAQCQQKRTASRFSLRVLTKMNIRLNKSIIKMNIDFGNPFGNIRNAVVIEPNSMPYDFWHLTLDT